MYSIADLRKLLAKNKTEEAVEKIIHQARENGDKTIEDEALLISAKIEKLKKDQRIGILANNEESVITAKVNNALLELINQIGKTDKVGSLKRRKPNYSKVLLFLLAIFIVSATYFFYLKKINSNPETLSLTVFVQGKQGLEEKILKGEGKVVMYLRTKPDIVSINENGEATFKEIPKEFEGRKVKILIDHPQPYQSIFPDSLYIIKNDQVINLEISLKGIDKVYGNVMDFEKEIPIDSVRVSIQDIHGFTNEYGDFSIHIPTEKQRKFQKIRFYKKGYQLYEIEKNTVHLNQGIPVSLQKRTQ